MLPFVTIRQDILSHWAGFDFNDAAIIALVVSMDPRNPRVRALHSGESLCTTKYILEMLPMIGCGPERIRKRVQKLVRSGVLDTVLIFNKLTGHRLRYLKPSRFYYAELRRVERRADLSLPGKKRPSRAREYGVENDPLLLESKTTPDHLNDQRETPPPLSAAGGASEEKNSLPRCPACGKALHYLEWFRCEHCSADFPGGLTAREYFAAAAGSPAP